MSKKKIVIKEVVKNALSSSSNIDGEWNTHCDIDFILDEPCKLNLFDEEITIDRVKMYIQYWETCLSFANSDNYFDCFKVPKNFVNAIYRKVLIEQNGGFMKGYSFGEDLLDMLQE